MVTPPCSVNEFCIICRYATVCKNIHTCISFQITQNIVSNQNK